MNSNRIKLIAATVGAGAAIAGATAVGVASADNQPFLNEPGTPSSILETASTTVSTPTPAPEAGSSIDAVTTTETTSEAGPPPAAG